MQPKPKIHPAVAALIVIVLVGIVASVVIVVNNSNNSDKNTSTTQSTEETQPAGTSEETATDTPAVTNTSGYADGTYNATASYVTPGGIESIDLTLTIASGVITNTELAASGNSDHAEGHQMAFEAEYKDLIVSKSVDEVSLSRVAGSSLTTNAFNDALEQIKTDAQA